MNIKLLLLVLVSTLAFSDTLNSGLEVGTSVSHYYDSRSVFTNPSALSYQTLLNNARLTSSFEYAFSDGAPNDFAFSMAYGSIGLGFEKLSVMQDPYLRFSGAAGVPIGKKLFLGGRYSFTSSENDSLKAIHSVDLGLQVRATSYLSLGLMFNKLNRPTVGNLQAPIQCVAGMTWMPHKRWMIQGDIETSGDKFANHFGYQVNAQFEAFKGVYLSGGYHEEYKYQVGIKLNLRRLSFFATAQPTSNEKMVVVGMQTMPLPNHSFAFRPRTLHLVLDHTLSNEGRDGNFFSEGSPSLLDLLERLKVASEDSSLSNLTLEIHDFPLGLASAEELSRAVRKVRESGKKVTAVVGNADTKSYLIASAATEIVMDPEGELRILGPRAERFYAKGTLDKLGVSAEFLAKGEYKSFPETFTRKEASEASRKATTEELKKIESELLEIFSKNRKLSKSTWNEILNKVILKVKKKYKTETPFNFYVL
mgnify:FL=1